MPESPTTGQTPGALHRFNRWLYRGGRPNRLARAMNRISAALFARGWIKPELAATLEVVGRRTGRTISFPVVVTQHGGDRYLVSMLGGRSEWPRNLRAAEGRAVLRHGRRESVRLVEVDPADRAPVLRSYVAVAPGGRSHIPVDRHAPLAQFEQVAANYPVFRIIED